MHILISGGTGFVGRALTETLLQKRTYDIDRITLSESPIQSSARFIYLL